MEENAESSSNENQLEKAMNSEGETRNPTTSKKTGLSPIQFRRTEPFPFGRQNKKVSGSCYKPYRSLCEHQYSIIKLDHPQAEEYSNAEKIDQQIQRAKQQMQRKKTKYIQRTQMSMRLSMNNRFERQMKHFERVWLEHFEQFNYQQLRKMIQFKEKQQQLLKETRGRLNKRCHSLRTINKQLIDLEQRKKYFEQKGNFQELRLIKQERKKVVTKVAKQRQHRIDVWTNAQERKFSRHQLNKYQCFVKKLEQARSDLTKLYLHEKARLHQKHQNVLSSLEHEQRMSIQRPKHSRYLNQSQ